MNQVLIASAAAGLTLVNVAASVAVLRDSGLTRRQRLLQLVLVWAIPVLGALATFVFRRWTSAVPTVGGSAPAISADVATSLSAASHEHHQQ
jgi:hypothetical protein